MAFSPITWVNGTTPAVDAPNLNRYESFLPSVWYSSTGTGGDDGNGGQPPAPKPSSSPAGGADSPGQYYSNSISAGGIIYYAGSAPKSGIWKLLILTYNISTNVINPAYTFGGIGSGTLGAGTVPNGHSTIVLETVRLS